MPLPAQNPCAGCGTTEALLYHETNAAELGHAKHGRLCAACWREWMHGRRWAGKGSQPATDDLERSWEEAEAMREPAKPQAVDLFGKPVDESSKPRRRRR